MEYYQHLCSGDRITLDMFSIVFMHHVRRGGHTLASYAAHVGHTPMLVFNISTGAERPTDAVLNDMQLERVIPEEYYKHAGDRQQGSEDG